MAFSFDTSYKNLDSKLYSGVTPKDIDSPEVLLRNEALCENLGIDNAELTGQVLAGQERLEEPIAQAYAGHQFGSFTVLGDGRAMILGEHVHDGNRYDIQLKGLAGLPTRDEAMAAQLSAPCSESISTRMRCTIFGLPRLEVWQ